MFQPSETNSNSTTNTNYISCKIIFTGWKHHNERENSSFVHVLNKAHSIKRKNINLKSFSKSEYKTYFAYHHGHTSFQRSSQCSVHFLINNFSWGVGFKEFNMYILTGLVTLPKETCKLLRMHSSEYTICE